MLTRRKQRMLTRRKQRMLTRRKQRMLTRRKQLSGSQESLSEAEIDRTAALNMTLSTFEKSRRIMCFRCISLAPLQLHLTRLKPLGWGQGCDDHADMGSCILAPKKTGKRQVFVVHKRLNAGAQECKPYCDDCHVQSTEFAQKLSVVPLNCAR